MPYAIVPNFDGCAFAVVKKDTSKKIGCHNTRAQALQQLKALYAAEPNPSLAETTLTDNNNSYHPLGGGKMPVNATYLVDVSALTFMENQDASWVHALPIGSYKHPMYGTIDVTTERIKRFMDNVKNKVRGTVEPSINYQHNNQDVAAGWVKDAEARSDGLWVFVEWVKDAAEAIRQKKWRYFSSEFVDEWEDPGTKVKHQDVFVGGGLTNRPFMKNLVPINLSETTVDTALELVSLISGTPVDVLKGGTTMPLSEEDLKKIVDGVAEKVAPKPTTPMEPLQVKLSDIPEIKELAEQNPLVKVLVDQVEQQRAAIDQSAVQLKEQQVTARLSEFDRSKIVLTPVAKELVKELSMKLSEDSLDNFWKLLSEMRRGSSFLVEVGERAGATINYGSPKSAVTQFTDLATQIRNERKLSEPDAFEAAAAENRALYERYRNELMGVNR